jgi:hypothetical protein
VAVPIAAAIATITVTMSVVITPVTMPPIIPFPAAMATLFAMTPAMAVAVIPATTLVNAVLDSRWCLVVTRRWLVIARRWLVVTHRRCGIIGATSVVISRRRRGVDLRAVITGTFVVIGNTSRKRQTQ